MQSVHVGSADATVLPCAAWFIPSDCATRALRQFAEGLVREDNMVCEKCWGDAYFRYRFVDSGKSQSEHYRELLEERKDNPCTPEEQDVTDTTNES